MVSAIGGSGSVQALPVRVETRTAQETAATATAIDAGTATVPSEQTAAAARVGGQLDAQFDAGRVQRAQEEAPAAGAARAGGGAAGGSAASGYIAEADTNNDRKVSEEERAAYAKKQASEVAGKAAAAQQSREQEVRQAYVPQEASGSQLDVSV